MHIMLIRVEMFSQPELNISRLIVESKRFIFIVNTLRNELYGRHLAETFDGFFTNGNDCLKINEVFLRTIIHYSLFTFYTIELSHKTHRIMLSEGYLTELCSSAVVRVAQENCLVER